MSADRLHEKELAGGFFMGFKYDIVGGHLANYDFMIALNHFKGHPMGGYGGALKNLSIGCASQNGKAYIHSAGKMEKLDMRRLWTPEFIGDQDGFLESMAAAAQGVVNYFQRERGIIYISVMNNMSIDCDCVDHPEPVKLEDYGILASRSMMGYGVSTGSAGGISLRGVTGGAGQLLVLIDGHPQYNGVYGHPISDSYQTLMAERVEVLRGPASVLYGSNAMGGVNINI